jgi:hypothetical protein
MKDTSSSSSSSSIFDKDLKQIKHSIKFPSLIFYVGENYSNLKKKRILLIDQSHYFPQNSTIHYEANNWH